MNESTPPTSLFGIPLVVERADATEAVEDLTTLWIRQMGRNPNRIDKDLDALKILFDPLARGVRLRRLLAALPDPPNVSSRLLQSPVILRQGEEILITLEGRVALAHLQALLELGDSDLVHIDPRAVYAAEHEVYERYRQWSIKRISDVLRLQAGEAQALPLPSVASVLLLLINRSRSPETALRRVEERDDSDRDLNSELDGAIGRMVAAFCEALGAPQRDARHFSLYSGYALTEVRRRLSEAMGSNSEQAYILSTHEDKALRLVAAELSRPHRWFSVPIILAAFDKLVEAYRTELPALAALSMAHERRTETRGLRRRLETALNDYRTRS